MSSTTERAARMCPQCGGWCGVYKSWETANGTYMRRRYCPVCNLEYETAETATGRMRARRNKSRST